MTKKELIANFEKLKKDCEEYIVVALNEKANTKDKELASYYSGFAWAMEVAKAMVERSGVK